MNKDDLYAIWLSLVFMHKVSYMGELIDSFGSFKEIFNRGDKEIDFSRYPDTVKNSFSMKDTLFAEDIYESCGRNGIDVITYMSDEYPENFKNIDDPPIVLYGYGYKANLKKPLITVTGKRKPTRDGLSDAAYFASQISKSGVGVVTGFADGIETEVFKNTEAVTVILPGGILKPYPKFNTKYIKKIVDRGGLIISEYPPENPSRAYNFKYRNRLLGGISDSTLVIEAGAESGTKMTVNACISYGRDVYALPGSIHSPHYEGNNSYIRNGAIAVTHPSQIISDYYIKYEHLYKPEKIEENTDGLDDNELKIFNTLKNGALTTEEIIIETKLEPSTVRTGLISLEMSGTIRCVSPDSYEINRR